MHFPVGCPLFIYLFILNTLCKEPDQAQPADPRLSPGSGPRPPLSAGFYPLAVALRSPLVAGRRAEPRRRRGRCSRTSAGAAAGSEAPGRGQAHPATAPLRKMLFEGPPGSPGVGQGASPACGEAFGLFLRGEWGTS